MSPLVWRGRCLFIAQSRRKGHNMYLLSVIMCYHTLSCVLDLPQTSTISYQLCVFYYICARYKIYNTWKIHNKNAHYHIIIRHYYHCSSSILPKVNNKIITPSLLAASYAEIYMIISIYEHTISHYFGRKMNALLPLYALGRRFMSMWASMFPFQNFGDLLYLCLEEKYLMMHWASEIKLWAMLGTRARGSLINCTCKAATTVSDFTQDNCQLTGIQRQWLSWW